MHSFPGYLIFSVWLSFPSSSDADILLLFSLTIITTADDDATLSVPPMLCTSCTQVTSPVVSLTVSQVIDVSVLLQATAESTLVSSADFTALS